MKTYLNLVLILTLICFFIPAKSLNWFYFLFKPNEVIKVSFNECGCPCPHNFSGKLDIPYSLIKENQISPNVIYLNSKNRVLEQLSEKELYLMGNISELKQEECSKDSCSYVPVLKVKQFAYTYYVPFGLENFERFFWMTSFLAILILAKAAIFFGD